MKKILLFFFLIFLSCDNSQQKIPFEVEPTRICLGDEVKLKWDLVTTENISISISPNNGGINIPLTSIRDSTSLIVNENTTFTMNFPNDEKTEKFVNVIPNEGDNEELNFSYKCIGASGYYDVISLTSFFGKSIKITTIQNTSNRDLILKTSGEISTINRGSFSNAFNGLPLASFYSVSIIKRIEEGCPQVVNSTNNEQSDKILPPPLSIKIAYACD